MYCLDCGSEVAEGRRFCGKCGGQLNAGAAGNMEALPIAPGIALAVAPARVLPVAPAVAASAPSKSFRVGIAILLVLAAAGGARWWHMNDLDNELNAAGTVRTLIIAETLYSNAYPAKGFADSLNALGPGTGNLDQNHAGYIGAALANGTVFRGYQFAISIPDGTSTGGTSFNYFIQAKPAAGHRGHSFCADSSGAIHYANQAEECTVTLPTVPTPASCFKGSSGNPCIADQLHSAYDWQRLEP